MAPFIVRFAQQLPIMPRLRTQYDPVRQVLQVFQDGQWIDAVDARDATQPETKFTRMHRETTDDA